MAVIIHHSVGQGGRNETIDVRVVQRLLNDYLTGTGQLLNVDGRVGPKTLAAIQAFQTKETGVVDGRFDPNGPAINKLGELHIKRVMGGLSSQFTGLLKGLPVAPTQVPTLFLENYWLLLRKT
ncbi:MAG: peptidoglycan-binding protein [Rubrivivax sp.]|nr:MAG: peptidoglycan-binding protein [Rubrivivax sp.]